MIRRMVVLIAVAAMFSGCSLFRRGRLSDSDQAVASATNASPWGEWVLFTNPDSTAFVGASQVELSLTPTSFQIVARYPGRGPAIVKGTASITPTGLLTLTPEASGALASGGSFGLVPGQPFSVVASAADGTMVFAPPVQVAPSPTSVWHRADRARQAGQLSAQQAAKDSL